MANLFGTGIVNSFGQTMNTILISYDLIQPGQDYQALDEALQSLKAWRVLDSTWILETHQNTTGIYEYLRKFIDDNDKLLVSEINPSTAMVPRRRMASVSGSGINSLIDIIPGGRVASVSGSGDLNTNAFRQGL